MRCTHCGAMIPDDMLRCPECGMEVQIVPDYNPLDDVLAQEVRGSVEDATRQIRTDDIRRYRREDVNRDATRVLNSGDRRYSNATRVLRPDELNDIRAGRGYAPHQNYGSARSDSYARRERESGRQNTGSYLGAGRDSMRRNTNSMRQNTNSMRRDTGSMRQNTDSMRRETGSVRQNADFLSEQDARERRRQQIAKRKRAAKKRRQKMLLIVLLVLIALGVGGFFLYQNSYNGLVNRGNQALQSNDYSAAETYFKRAAAKNSQKVNAYIGLSKVYSQQGDMEGAESVFLTAISAQPSNAELYKAAIQFYADSKQYVKVSELLEDCEDESVLSAVSDYVSKAPTFSLEEGTYSEVQEVALSVESGGTIYYTTDGSEPTTSSTKYTESVLLAEGENTIKAFSVNKKKIPSVTVTKIYTIELPIEDAPAVTPSTGQYDTATQITINVPEGYTAYYTLDGTEPPASASAQQYTGPIDMPEGQTLFCAVLVSKSGKITQITKRNYVLETSE